MPQFVYCVLCSLKRNVSYSKVLTSFGAQSLFLYIACALSPRGWKSLSFSEDHVISKSGSTSSCEKRKNVSRPSTPGTERDVPSSTDTMNTWGGPRFLLAGVRVLERQRWGEGVPLGTLGSLSTRTGNHDGNVSETIKLIAEDKRSTWICEIDMISGSSCLTCDFNCFIFGLLSGRGHHFEKLPQSLFGS